MSTQQKYLFVIIGGLVLLAYLTVLLKGSSIKASVINRQQIKLIGTQTTAKGYLEYINKKYGYRIKYPSDLTVNTPYGPEQVEIKDTTRFYTIIASELSGTTNFEGKEREIKDLSPKEIITMELRRRCKESDLTTIVWTEIKIGELEGVEASYSSDVCVNRYLPWFVVIRNGISYHIKFIKGYQDEYRQIITSLHFE